MFEMLYIQSLYIVNIILIRLLPADANILAEFNKTGSDEKYPGCQDKDRHQNNERIKHISEKAGHLDVVFLGNGAHHEVRRVADISARAHKDGSGRNCLQDERMLGNQFNDGRPLGDAVGKITEGGC